MGVPPGNVEPEAYLNSKDSTPEGHPGDGHIRGRSRRFVKYPGYNSAVTYQLRQMYNDNSIDARATTDHRDNATFTT